MASAVPFVKEDQTRLWGRYHRARGLQAKEAARNALTEHYLPLVRACARKLANRLPSHVELGDLNSNGMFGLFDAIDRFDPGRRVAFTTYARHKINSALLDYLRSIDRAPRLLRRRLRMIDEARQRFLQRHGRPATDEEVAGRTGLSVEQVARVQLDAKSASPLRMSQMRADDSGDFDREPSMAQTLADPNAAAPEVCAELAGLRKLMLAGLSRAEQLLIVLYYYEDMSMREVGLTLNLSESRICQMHGSILDRLRARLGHRADVLESLLPHAG